MPRTITAIDPGPEFTAYVHLVDGGFVGGAKRPNEEVAARLVNLPHDEAVVIEMVASYGMAVGREVFETVYWIGRYAEIAEGNVGDVHRVVRQAVKLHLCGSSRANDSTIRQALVDRFGPGKDRAIGKKASPGPLYGVAGDVWAALALAVTWHDLGATCAYRYPSATLEGAPT